MAAVRENKLGTGVTAIIVLGILAVAAYGVFALLHRQQPQYFQNVTATKVTDSGKVIFANIAPDGKYILSVVRENGLASLSLRNVPTNSTTQVDPPAPLYYLGVRFSPDSEYLYFIRSEPGNDELKYLFRAPLLGGAPQKLAADVDSNITFSPDGTEFAFIRNDNPQPGKYQLIVHSTSGSQERVLTDGPIGERLFQPAWSPDGKIIMCGAINIGNAFDGLVAVDASTGKRTAFFSANDRVINFPTWLPNGRGLVVLVSSESSNFNRNQIGLISYPDGKMSSITHDTNDYSDLSIATSGNLLATVLYEQHWAIYITPSNSDGSQSRQLTTAESSTNFTWTKNNQLIADQQNVLNLIKPDTGERTVIQTEQGANGDPSACADGKYVTFVLLNHGNTGSQNVWRMDSSSGNLKQLTNGKSEDAPWCSPDSRWVYYVEVGDERLLARTSIDGGTPQIISNYRFKCVRSFR